MSKAREVSATRLARCLAFLGLSFFIAWLAGGDKLSRLVNPRMNPWIIGAGIGFLVLALVQMLRLPKRPIRGDPLTFFVPLAYVVAIVYIFVQDGASATGEAPARDDTLAIQSSFFDKRDRAADDASTKPLPQTIIFDDDLYWALYNRLYDEPAAAAGHRVVIQGFLRKANTLPPGMVLIARNLMWCCSADMTEIGLVARGSLAAGIRASTWVEATGRLSTAELDADGDGKKSLVPCIELDSIRPVEKAASGVIFPF
jgi:putative membrane protein